MQRAEHRHHVWRYDFVHDQTTDGRALKCLTVVDEFTCEGLAIHCARSLTATDVIHTLTELIKRSEASCLKSDNGPQFVATAVREWLEERNIGSQYIAPGSPWQCLPERFNSIFRTTRLNRWAFESMSEAQAVIRQ